MKFYFRIIFVFLFTTILFTNCQKTDQKPIFNEAEKLASEKKYKEAVTKYEQISVDDPKSEYSLKSLYTAGKIYQSLLVPGMERNKSMYKAIELYRKAYSQFPGKEEAESSMMMVGFIFANELTQIDSAKVAYKLFLDTYPKSQLVNSVKLEYENLGLTPEQILEKKIESGKK